MKLLPLISRYGIVDLMFMVDMLPIRTVAGLISYTSSSDAPVTVPAKINSDRYDPLGGYKITLKSIYPGFGSEHFYLSDLEGMIDDGRVRVFVNAQIV
jgi:hypothetical protein